MSAGIYSWMPLGLRVLEKLSHKVAQVMDEGGISKMLMPTLQDQQLWQQSGRLNSYGKELLRFEDRHQRGLLYSPTNEEMITHIVGDYIKSYKDLPLRLYQIQWKFRDEIRPRFGVMRAREFLMKDAYSFDETPAQAEQTYDIFFGLYLELFKRLGLEAVAVRADSGAIGGNLSHEFHVLAKSGESKIHFESRYAQVASTGDVAKLRGLYAVEQDLHTPKTAPKSLTTAQSIEVGHVFYFGAKYSEKMKLELAGKQGNFYPHMGSYGIGIARLVAALIEVFSDSKGIVWHPATAPFEVAVVNMVPDKCLSQCESIYNQLRQLGVDVLLEDRPLRTGAKLADMELIGIPYVLVVAPKEIEQGKVMLRHRQTGKQQTLTTQEVLTKLHKAHQEASN